MKKYVNKIIALDRDKDTKKIALEYKEKLKVNYIILAQKCKK